MVTEGRTERRAVLAGDAARRWVGRNGFVFTSGEDPRVAGDVLERNDFLMIREWRTAMRTHLPRGGPEGLAWFLFPLEGHVHYLCEGRKTLIRPDDWLVFESAYPAFLSNEKPFAYTAVRVDAARFTEVFEPVAERCGVRLPVGDAGRCLAALLMTVFNSDLSDDDPSFPHMISAIRHMLTAQLNASRPNEPAADRESILPGEARIYRRAVEILSEMHGDPSFRINDLSKELGVSMTYINRAFSSSGSTPMKHLERLRVQSAMRIAESGTTAFLNRTEVAKRSGFRSVRSLRRALEKAGMEGEGLLR